MIGYRQFVEDSTNADPLRRPFIMLEFRDGLDRAELAAPYDLDYDFSVPSYDFGAIPTSFELGRFNELRNEAFKVGDAGRFDLPHDNFAVVMSIGPARIVAMVRRDATGERDDAGNTSPYWAQCFMHNPRHERFEDIGQAALGSFSTHEAINVKLPDEITDHVRAASRDTLLRGAAHALDVCLFLLHLRSEDRIIRWQMMPESGAHKAMNYKRRQAGEAQVEPCHIVYVSAEPLVKWLGTQQRGAVKGSHASPVPHDRREYWRRPKGGSEKTVLVRATKVLGGARETVSYEVRLREGV